MYNARMVDAGYEIRTCNACGLRYPIAVEHPLGRRCPACMGETRLILRHQLVTERRPPLRLVPAAQPKATRAVLLDNIRSAWNVGSILRSADGFGFSHAYICGITPTPDHEAVTKTALGAQDAVPWSYHKDAVMLAKGLKKEGWNIFALEEDEGATEIDQISMDANNSALIVGNEVSGVDLELMSLCDDIVFIPMRGEKKSFNVAVAFGIAAFALSRE
jgi:23S rRNA (guanosine2251-2'-O)-methyltransferase